MSRARIPKTNIDYLETLVTMVNQDILTKYDGAYPVLSVANLHFSLWHALKEAKKRRDDLHRVWAAHTLRELARVHPFEEGNKRTAYVISKLILRAGGYNMDVEYEDATHYIRKIATGSVPYEEVYLWITRHARPTNEELTVESKKFIDLLTKAAL